MEDIVKVILLVVLEILSVFISIIIFIYFITHRVDRSKPKNHVWLILLTISFLQLLMNVPMPISFYSLGRIWPATDAYCVWWTWFEYSSCATSLILMAWASIERHLFVFYPRLLLGAWWKKLVYHFGPIFFCIIWPALCYMGLAVIRPNCINEWDFSQTLCGLPCFAYANGGIYGIIHLSLNVVIPVTIITVGNIALISRVIYQKLSRRLVVNWRSHRRMAFQLWFISSLYLTCWLPLTLTHLIRITMIPSFLNDQLATLFFLVYFIPLLLPMVCLGAFPEIIRYIREIIRRQKRNRVTVIQMLPTQFKTE